MQPFSEYTEVSADCVTLSTADPSIARRVHRLTCSNIIQIKNEFNGIIYHNYQMSLEQRTRVWYILYTQINAEYLTQWSDPVCFKHLHIHAP